MSLTLQERNEAQNILSNQGAAAFYTFLRNKGEPYGRLGQGVSNNDSWQGQVANAFANNGATDNNVDLSVGSNEWNDLNNALAQKHLDAYVLNNGNPPTRIQIQDYHNDEYRNAGLNVDDWLPNRLLNTSDDPDALWTDWMTNDNPLDLWQDLIGVAEAGGNLLFGPYLLYQAIANPDGLDPAQLEFAKNLANALLGLDPAGRADLAKDLLGDLYDLPADYGWAWNNPGAVLNELPQWMQGVAGKFFEGVAQLPPSPYSPLVLDLDGDGIELTDVNGPGAVYFDLDNDGFAERAGWVTGGDGLLVLDRNGNGTIDAQNELFGDTATAANGFENLKALDSNGDNQITSADAQWNDLRVWVDANADGVSQTAEMTTLSGLSITLINLAYANVGYDLAGNQIRQESTFVQNGVMRPVVDAWFAYDRIDSEYVGGYTLDVRTLFLPTLRGYGDVKDLHVAMSEDETLLNMVMVLATATVADVSDPTFDYKGKMQAMIERWAGVENVSTGGNANFSFRNFAEMKKFMGMESLNYYIPDSSYTDPLRDSMKQLTDFLTARFLAQTSAFAGQMSAYNPITDQFEDGMGVMSLLAYPTGGILSAGTVGSTNHVLMFGQAANDTFYGGAGNDRLYGDGGNDQLLGRAGNDILNGGIGNDSLWGDAGDDTLNGDAGSDSLTGGDGNDVLNGGDGNDSLWGDAGDDTLNGDAGSDSLTGGDGNDVLNGGDADDTLRGNAGDDTLNGDAGGDSLIGGTGNDSLRGGIDDDILQGNEDDDILFGDEGNDWLFGGDGNDFLNGGIGNDTLWGDAGDDTYVFSVGDSPIATPDSVTVVEGEGIDTIKLLGVLPQNAYMFQDQSVLGTWRLRYSPTDEILINGMKQTSPTTTESSNYTISKVAFDDGTVWDFTAGMTINDTNDSHQLTGTDFSDTLNGNGGDDTIYGESGSDTLFGGDGDDFIVGSQSIFSTDDGLPDNDIIDGGRGADNMYGSWGNDTYIFRAGDSPSSNPDYVNEIVNQGTDTIKLTGGILPSDVTFTKSSSNYWYSLKFGTDEIRIVNYIFDSSTSISSTNTLAVEKLSFDNGTVVNLADIINAPPPPPNTNPVAQDDIFTGNEDIQITGNVLASNGNGVDSDADGNFLSVVALSGLATSNGGMVNLLTNGNFTYTPATNFNGSDSFAYTLQDGQGGSDTGLVSLTINAVNDNPLAMDDSFMGDQDTQVTGNVLANNGSGADSDVDGNPLNVVTATGLTTAQGGTVNLVANGSFTYTPAANFFGSDSFSYTLQDGQGGSDTGLVNLTINQVTSPPPSSNIITDEDFEGGATGWNDNRTDGAEPFFTEFLGRFWNGDGSQQLFKTFALDGNQSQITIDFDFYRIDSWDNEPFKIYLNDNLILTENYHHSTAKTAATGTFAGGTWERDAGIPIDHYGFRGGDYWMRDGVYHYTLTLDTTATTLKLGFGAQLNEVANTETWGIDNLVITSDSGSAPPPPNVDPVAQDDLFTGDQDVAITGNLLADNGNGTDTDSDGGTLSVVAASGLATTAGGSVDILADGSFTYTPASGFTGIDSFTYTLQDGQGGSDTGLVSLTLNVTGTPPSAPSGAAWLLDPVAGATGWSNSSTINTADFLQKTHSVSFETGADVTTAQMIYEQGSYARGINFVIDGGKLYAAVWVVNTGSWGFKEIAADVAPNTKYTATLVVDGVEPANGTATLYLNGVSMGSIGGVGKLLSHTGDIAIGHVGDKSVVHNITVTDELTFTGTVEKIAHYNAALSGSDLTQLHNYMAYNWLTAAPPSNVNPVAQDDIFTGNQDIQITGNLLSDNGNGADTDSDGGTLSVVAASGLATTAGGSVDILADGSFTYTPAANYFGADSFSYTLQDGQGGSDTGLVNLTINQVTSPPPSSNIITDEDFEGGASGWNDNQTDGTEPFFTEFLGRFWNGNGSQELFKTFALDGSQSQITIDFDFYRIDSWDNEPFNIYLNDNLVLSELYRHSTAKTAESGTFAGGTWERDAGIPIDHYGFRAGDTWMRDSVYHYTLKLDTTATTLKLGFGAQLNEVSNTESWGIDNVVITSDSEQLYGTAGADVFAWLLEDVGTGIDVVHGFNTAQGDSLDVSDILSGYDPLTDLIADFVQITDNGTDSFLAVDADGGANNFVHLATLQGVTGLTDEDALETTGNLVGV